MDEVGCADEDGKSVCCCCCWSGLFGIGDDDDDEDDARVDAVAQDSLF